jgi:N-acetylmuramoyl-L-alanine amidase
MAFSAPAENVPVTFFAEGLADAPAAALSARSEWPVYSVTGPLFETRARSQPGAGETVAFLPPNLRLQGAGFVGSNTRIWLAGALSFAENRFLSAETESSPPPPRESPLPDLSAGFGPYPPTNRTPEQILIVIDPGHGGSSTGAIGPTGVTEKQATLEQAQVIKATLERAGFRVLLTRDRDVDRGLYERVQLAYSARAAAFISVHYNSCGASSSPEASRHIATYCWNPIGEQLARALHPHLASVTPIANRGVCTASFAVCRNPAIPSCLAELDFITCPEGEEALRQPDRQRKVAEALLEGLRDWLGRAAP